MAGTVKPSDLQLLSFPSARQHHDLRYVCPTRCEVLRKTRSWSQRRCGLI